MMTVNTRIKKVTKFHIYTIAYSMIAGRATHRYTECDKRLPASVSSHSSASPRPARSASLSRSRDIAPPRPPSPVLASRSLRVAACRVVSRHVTSCRVAMSHIRMQRHLREKLIEQIQKYPILYNTNHENHRDNDLRDCAWNQIAEVLGVNSKLRHFYKGYYVCYSTYLA